MAMIPCPECKKEISDQAEACPSCGRPRDKSQAEKDKAGQSTRRVIAAVVVLLIVGFFALGASESAKRDRLAAGGAYEGRVVGGANKEECARLLARGDPQARVACSGLEINGVRVIQ